ncbi:hypothetical protein D9758_006581 [Tetrapyrgos nigripes]|uniref:Uncharacterized protein n=1 Tax=Tetrapyrgos nigripes TaxID=182062 RepID=A0A8H5LRC8_9AGAR|nr:hypothetical protein D9758_006581 [Tetrapyrgos nigripes]
MKSKKRGQGRKHEAPVNPTLDPWMSRITTLANRWMVMNEPWINVDIFGHPVPTDLPDPFSPARFIDKNTYTAGTIAELHRHLQEPRLQELAATFPAFKSEFRKAVNNHRTHTTDRVRQHAAIILCELSPPACIGVARSGEECADSELLKTLWTQGKKDISDEKLAPIFFPEQIINPHTTFLNEYQPRIIRINLFAPSAIKNPDAPITGKHLVGFQWGVRSVNASCIAWSAIMSFKLCFIVSPDKEFTEVGTISRIPYREHFQAYRKMIVLAESKGTPWAKSLYDFYNRRVFAGVSGMEFAASPSSSAAVDELDELMQHLMAPNPLDAAFGNTSDNLPPIISSSNAVPIIPARDSNTQTSSPSDAAQADDNDDLESVGTGSLNAPRGRGRGRGRGGSAQGKGKAKDVSSSAPEAEPERPARATRSRRT